MVQEPKTQDLRVEVFDWDRINVKELLTINVLKGMKDTLGSKTLMGRSAHQHSPLQWHSILLMHTRLLVLLSSHLSSLTCYIPW